MTDNQSVFMQMALECAASVKGTTAPNPSVGAVIVKSGEVIGRGATSPWGGPHAEINAIRDAGGEDCCRDADIYVTLEPCSHYGKTPPCSEAIIRSKFKRVYIAVLDPNPLVSGRGVTLIEQAGIEVEVGLYEREAKRMNEDFFHFILHKTPFVHVKLAMTLDGMVADADNKSKWITGPDSRTEVHRLRSTCSAITVGKGTLVADNPKLDVRHVDGTNPIRIVFVSSPKDFAGTYFAERAEEVRSIAVVGDDSPMRKEKDESGVEIWFTGSIEKGSSIRSFIAMAGEENIDSLLVEGGAGLVQAFLDEKLVNRLTIFYAGKILGGGKPGLQLTESRAISSPLELHQMESKQFGTDFMVTGLLYPSI